MSKPKYQIGDRLPGTEIYIRGVATLSTGEHRYFLQIEDDTLIFEAEDLEMAEMLGQLLDQAYGAKFV